MLKRFKSFKFIMRAIKIQPQPVTKRQLGEQYP